MCKYLLKEINCYFHIHFLYSVHSEKNEECKLQFIIVAPKKGETEKRCRAFKVVPPTKNRSAILMLDSRGENHYSKYLEFTRVLGNYQKYIEHFC